MREIEQLPGKARERCRIVAHGGPVWRVTTVQGRGVGAALAPGDLVEIKVRR